MRETLECTRKHGLKMNPNKCAFGVSVGQFLGFLVHERGIKIGQKSMKAIDEAVPLTTKTELQSLFGKINLSGGLFQICRREFYHFLPC